MVASKLFGRFFQRDKAAQEQDRLLMGLAKRAEQMLASGGHNLRASIEAFEIACQIPDCPIGDTLLLVRDGQGLTQGVRILKPPHEVQDSDLQKALENFI